MSKATRDLIVVGGGHAGIEAAAAACRMGCEVTLITLQSSTLGKMACNPAVGGVGKGQLVREIDALGGLMALAADRSALQFRRLNSSKGAAVQSTRVQVDSVCYPAIISDFLLQNEGLEVIEGEVEDLLFSSARVVGIAIKNGGLLYAKAVVLAPGTFLRGKIHMGLSQHPGGRYGEPSANRLTHRLLEISTGARLKTGTPPRLVGSSIDFSALQEQRGDQPPHYLSFLSQRGSDEVTQQVCHLTETSPKTHEVIIDHLPQSPLYSGQITGVGPRYCPSIEDKVRRFPNKNSHQIFLEPESLTSDRIYPNGISTSLPVEAQLKMVRSIRGLESAEIAVPGYAVEYDYLNPMALSLSLQHKTIEALFFAGQLNGTTGYEEAAAQGLLAGINAACYIKEMPFWLPRRDEAYLGVLVDDLTTRGASEPYRMFTSRAEFRLSLREDNADQRLTPVGHRLNLISATRWRVFQEKYEAIAQEKTRLDNFFYEQNTAYHWLKRPEALYMNLPQIGFDPALNNLDWADALQIEIKYEGYLRRQLFEAHRLSRSDLIKIPKTVEYKKISGLSSELVSKLSQWRPETIGQASRMEGMTPAALFLLFIFLKKLEKNDG